MGKTVKFPENTFDAEEVVNKMLAEIERTRSFPTSEARAAVRDTPLEELRALEGEIARIAVAFQRTATDALALRLAIVFVVQGLQQL